MKLINKKQAVKDFEHRIKVLGIRLSSSENIFEIISLAMGAIIEANKLRAKLRQPEPKFESGGLTVINKKRMLINKLNKQMKVEVIKEDGVVMPKYAQLHDSGMDVKCFANDITQIKQFNKDTFEIKPVGGGFLLPSGARVMIPSGLKVAIPQGYEIQVRSRSGLALKKGLIVVQGIGTIDSTYRGKLGICIANIGSSTQIIEWGERIAQLVLVKVEVIEWAEVAELSETDRGAGGFGSSGTH